MWVWICLLMGVWRVAWTADEVWRLQDRILSPAAAQMSPYELAAARQVLADHRIELFMRPSSSPGDHRGNGVPGNPGASPKQLAVAQAFWTGQYRTVAAIGANRSGKTQAVAGFCFCRYLRDRARDGEDFWVVAQTETDLHKLPQRWMWEFLPRSMFPRHRPWREEMGFGKNPVLPLTLPEQRGRCTVTFKTEEQDLNTFEGVAVAGVWWTEASYEPLLTRLRMRLTDYRGWLLMDYVPRLAWQKERVHGAADPTIFVTRFGTADNAHNLPAGEVLAMRRSLPERDAKVVIDGQDGAMFGVVYREFDVVKHVVRPFALDAKALFRCYDYGYSNPSACLWVCLLPVGFPVPREAGGVWAGKTLDREVAVVYREMYVTEHTIPQQAAKIKAMSGDERYRFDGRLVADPAIYQRNQVGYGRRAKSIAELLQEAGVKTKKGVRASTVEEDAMVAKVRMWFELDKLLFFDTCPNAIREHQSWSHKFKQDGELYDGGERYEDRNNHTTDALKELIAERGLTYDAPTLEYTSYEH